MDWSEWHPSGTVALDWLPLDMFHICVMIAAGLHYFGTKGIITLDPPFVPTVCQQIMIFTRIGGLGLLLPWSLTNSGLWPHTPNIYPNYVATDPSGTENYPVTLQWQSGKQLANWLSIGKNYSNLV